MNAVEAITAGGNAADSGPAAESNAADSGPAADSGAAADSGPAAEGNAAVSGPAAEGNAADPGPAEGATPSTARLVVLCPICLENVKEKIPMVTLCGHVFCSECLQTWAANQNCPVCRKRLRRKDAFRINF